MFKKNGSSDIRLKTEHFTCLPFVIYVSKTVIRIQAVQSKQVSFYNEGKYYFLEYTAQFFWKKKKKSPKIGVHSLFTHKHCWYCCLSLYDDLHTVLVYPSKASVMRVQSLKVSEKLHVVEMREHLFLTLWWTKCKVGHLRGYWSPYSLLQDAVTKTKHVIGWKSMNIAFKLKIHTILACILLLQ
jgi:hypothetical protein